MQKVALIFPNYILREKFGNPSDQPLGIGYIASELEARGHKVKIIDANADNLSMEDIVSIIFEFKPNIIGISCNYSPLHNSTLSLSRILKRKINVPIVIGGNHASALAEYILNQSNSIDIVIRGEGEEIMPKVVEWLENKKNIEDIFGISYKKSDKIYSNPDAPLIENLDSLPFPAYHLLPMEKYSRYNIITSRGCPYNCSYCASNIIFKQKVRHRNPEKVVDEIEFLYKKYGNKYFWFSDDTFTSDTKYLDKLLDEIIKRGLSIKWSCVTRVNLVSKDLLQKMKKAGCDYISYGVESGNEKILSEINKKISIIQIKEALELTKKADIRTFTFFLVGNPNETWETIKDSYKLITEIKPDGASFAVVIPLPGTKMCKDLMARELINYGDIKWDYLFAKIPGSKYEEYAADLASKWCKLSPTELIKACKIGEALPHIIKLHKEFENIFSFAEDNLSKIYDEKLTKEIPEKQIFFDTLKIYINLLNGS